MVLKIGKLLKILSYIGFVCFIFWIVQLIYLLFTQGFSSISFTTSDIILIVSGIVIAVLFGMNGHAHGRLTPLLDGVLSSLFYIFVIYACYTFGIYKGLAFYYVLIEIIGFIQPEYHY